MNDLAKEFEEYRQTRERMDKEKVNQVCDCGCTDIGVDNWGMFRGAMDLFFYCKNCDYTWGSSCLDD